MAPNPCPCMTLQNGVKTLALFDTVFNVLILGIFIRVLVSILFNNGDAEIVDGEQQASPSFIVVAIFIVILQLVLSFRLHKGAKEEDRGKCRSWLAVTIVIVCIYVITLVYNRTSGDFQGAGLVVCLVLIFYKTFQIAVVVAFAKSLKPDDQSDGWDRYPPVAASTRSHRPYPIANVCTIDSPPSYLQVQNEVSQVEPPPPPYCSDFVMVPQNGIANSRNEDAKSIRV